MPTDATARERYEAIYRAIGRQSRTGLLLCIVATVAVGAIYVIWLAGPLARALLDAGIPSWLATGLTTAIVLTVLVTVPNVAQLLVIRGDTAAAIEGVNAWGMAEAERQKRKGVPVPPLRKANDVMPWLTKHPDVRGSLRIRLLAWSGDLNQARTELASLHDQAPIDAFEKSLLSSMLDFVAGRPSDLRAATEALVRVPASDYGVARLALAFEQARVAHDAGHSWQAPLVAARREVTVPRAATILGRFLSGWRVSAAIVAGGTLLSVIATLLL